MVKSALISFILFCFISCTVNDFQSSSSQINIPVVEIAETDGTYVKEITPKECVINKSESFVGTEEIGNNQDFNNKELKTLLERSGWRPEQAWCSYIAKGILDDCGVPNKLTGWSPSSYNKSDVIFTDNQFKQDYDSEDVLLLSLSYNKYKSDKSRYKGIGHVGIVYKLTEYKSYSFEGNTTSEESISDNEGQGFYKKIRPLTNNTNVTRIYKQK